MAEFTFPVCFKIASIRPLLKKVGVDKEASENYRAVSNLNFFSKILETVVATRLECPLNDPKQSP